VIWESGPWKEELLRIADRLHRKTEQRRWTDRTDANLEKDVFVACYAIRKLMESHKLSKSVLSCQVACVIVPRRQDKRVSHYNWHKLHELYDFGGQSDAVLSLRNLCNQFIHSYIFCPVFSERSLLDAVAVASDRKRRDCIYVIRVDSLIDVLRAVGSDDPDEQRAVWDDRLGDYSITNLQRDLDDLSGREVAELLSSQDGQQPQ